MLLSATSRPISPTPSPSWLLSVYGNGTINTRWKCRSNPLTFDWKYSTTDLKGSMKLQLYVYVWRILDLWRKIMSEVQMFYYPFEQISENSLGGICLHTDIQFCSLSIWGKYHPCSLLFFIFLFFFTVYQKQQASLNLVVWCCRQKHSTAERLILSEERLITNQTRHFPHRRFVLTEEDLRCIPPPNI